MTRRLGGSKRALAAIASLSLAATLAFVGAISGCGSSNSSSSNDAGMDGAGMGQGMDSAPDSYVAADSFVGGDTYVADTYVADTYVADAGMQTALLAPTFNPPTGANNPGTVTIVAPANFPDAGNAFIYYTTNGTNPTPTSTVFTPGIPIKITQTTTIRAYATAPGFADSPIAQAMYTVSLEAGTLQPPSFSPAGGTAAAPTSFGNDFPVAISSTPGATICFTLDGSTPACSAGVCQGSSQTYNAQSQVPINGTTTSATNAGIATVNALACQSGATSTSVSTAVYELQAAQPSLQAPSPGTFPYQASAQAPTASSSTTGATLRFTNGSAAVSCTSSLTLPTGGGAATNPAAVPSFATSTTYNILACKPGYKPSNVLNGAYVVQLNPPVFATLGGVTFTNDVNPGIATAAADPGGSADWVCYTAGTTSTQPVCDTTNNATTHGCTTGLNLVTAGQPTVATSGTIINAKACTADATKYISSGVASSGTYTMQLPPVMFAPNGGSLGVGGTQSVTISNSASPKAYTGICYSNDGTVPACSTTSDTACAMGTFHAGNSVSGVAADAANLTLKAIGCPGTQVADANVGYIASVPGQAVFNAAGQLIAPVIHPSTGTLNNDVNVTFDNTNGAAVDICYTTDGSPVAFASATSCALAGGSTAACVNSVAANATGVAATSNPIVTATATTVIARACDPSGASTQSPPQSATYALQVGTVTISPASGTPNIGSLVTFSTPTAGTTFHYLTNATGGTTASCASGATVTATGTGPYTATYQLQGSETTISVVGCKGASGQYTPSAVASVAYTSYTVATPTFLFGSAASTFQDLLDGTAGTGTTEQVQVNPSYSGTPTWICQKSNAANAVAPACGAAVNTCATGSPANVDNAVISTVAAACTNASSVGDCFNDPVNATGTVINLVACSLPAGGAVISSATATASYTLQVSPITFSPAAGAQSGSVSVSATLTTATQGPASATPTQADSGNHVVFCLTATQSVPPQPAPNCASFGGMAPDWQCTTCTTGTCTASWTPAIGMNTSFNAFACKDGMTYSTTASSVSYTFGPYSHTISPLTGAVADFTASAEAIAALGSTTGPVTGGGAAYVSWDSTYVYVGFQSSDITGSPSGYVQFYIGGTSGGTSTADTVAVPGGGSLPAGFNGLYHVYWNGVSGTKVDAFNGSNWATTTIAPMTVYNGGSSTFVEFRIARSDISLVTTDLHLLGGFTLGSDARDVWPTIGSPASKNGGNCDTAAVTASGGCSTASANWTDWQTEFLTGAFSPNARLNISQP